MRISKGFLIAAGAGLLAGCHSASVRVSGRLIGCDGTTVYLEPAIAADNAAIDSVATDDMGNFRFDIAAAEGQPMLYNLRCNGERIPLLLAAGERVEVNSVGTLSRNYTVEGSAESELVREINAIMVGGAMTLDSIASLYGRTELDEQGRKQVLREYTQAYYGIKRAQIAFIVRNSSSLAAIYALYQRLPNDEVLFNGDNDVVYYRMVADSVGRSYPASVYLASLRRDIERMDLIGSIQVAETNYPDLELPDMFGKRVRLSSLEGKVILLDFWSAGAGAGNVANAELKELYGKYAPLGFEVYQVGIDESKAAWVNAVQEQDLPWVSVCDLKGVRSPALGIYNVQRLPANFLIDRRGNIVGKNLYGAALEARVRALVN